MANFLSRYLERSRLTQKQREQLADTLRGDQPWQACWADVPLRERALTSIADNFGSDWLWCMQTTLAIYFTNPQSIAHIDQIVAEHVESRRGAFPPALYEGRGWNPAKALNFDGEVKRFWRGYVAVGADHWTLFEMLKHPAKPNDYLTQSGFQFSGTRGCVRRITLSRGVDVASAGMFVETFVRAAGSVVANAVGGDDPDELWQAVRQLMPYEGRMGSVRWSFETSTFDERGTPPWRTFKLTLDHD